MVNDVVPEAELLDTCLELADRISANAPLAVAATKAALVHTDALALAEAIQREVPELARLRATDDFKEGVTSFLEKRPPKWTGH
jgi:enoyl-CoA hydratase